MKFELGQLVSTSSVHTLLIENQRFRKFVSECMKRYARCDWGDLCSDDAKQNDIAVKDGEDRILASYPCPFDPDLKIWIITEWDRSVTTILFPHEY